VNPIELIQPKRKITGISAVLLPYGANGQIDWTGFDRLVIRTCAAGLIPAVNMDTGFGNLLTTGERRTVLQRTQSVTSNANFVAGAIVADSPGTPFEFDSYARAIEEIAGCGATPVVCQSFGLTAGADTEILGRYERLAANCDRYIAFELGQMFAPFGKIYSLELYSQQMKIPQCIGAKHSSLNRELEWQRLIRRNELRPEFKVFTGNDLAIDMVMYGSDYLLGLSTMAPDAFALRDKYWLNGDPQFYELNDLLQYLGCFTFRHPVAAYKHSAAMFLKLRNWITDDATHRNSPTRPATDKETLMQIAAGLEKKILEH
jgi:dihydrodipicolinate synthase/N-acetylneuraminate lyase